MPARTILVVDDDDVLRDSLVEQLSLYEEFDIEQEATAGKGVQTARNGRVDARLADEALTRLDVDQLGLDAMDRRYLGCIAADYGGGPVGVETLAAALSEPRDAIEEIIEPYLIQQGLLQRTPRGRIATASAYTHFGLHAPTGARGGDLWSLEERSAQ